VIRLLLRRGLLDTVESAVQGRPVWPLSPNEAMVVISMLVNAAK
jgi:hypothetical protein